MATDRNPVSIFWSSIKSLVDTELVTMQLLYTEGLHRLHDSAFYVLGQIAQVYSNLASQATGGNAHIIGDVDLTLFDFNSGITLNGLTIIVDEDTVGAQTCTFPNTITSPALLLAALNSQCGTNLGWTITDNGYLKVISLTTGPSSTISLGAGTANALLFGSASVTSPGSSTANDGAARVGLAAFSGWPGGTLRDFIVALSGLIDILDDTTLAGNGGTLPQANYTILSTQITSRRTYFRIPALLANYEYTLPSAVADGTSIIFRGNPNAPFTVILRRPDATSIATIDFSLGVTQVQACVEVTKFGGTWVVTSFGISDDNYTLS